MSWEKPIQITPDMEFLVIGAVRYARGRVTYVVEETCEWVIAHWAELSENTRAVIARDVQLEVQLRREEGAKQSALARIVNPAWERLLDTAEKGGGAVTRPRIWKDQDAYTLPWRATHPDNPNLWRLCETWQEAMQFVGDELVNPFPLDFYPMTVTYEGGDVFITDDNDGDTIVLEPRHWRPLARALTRLADKEGVE